MSSTRGFRPRVDRTDGLRATPVFDSPDGALFRGRKKTKTKRAILRLQKCSDRLDTGMQKVVPRVQLLRFQIWSRSAQRFRRYRRKTDFRFTTRYRPPWAPHRGAGAGHPPEARSTWPGPNPDSGSPCGRFNFRDFCPPVRRPVISPRHLTEGRCSIICGRRCGAPSRTEKCSKSKLWIEPVGLGSQNPRLLGLRWSKSLGIRSESKLRPRRTCRKRLRNPPVAARAPPGGPNRPESDRVDRRSRLRGP